MVRIGTAGWALPKAHAAAFGAEGSHLVRYASRMQCVEINSSFHKPHRRSTWERWAASVPDDFRFSVKMPKRVTHEAKLVNAGAALQQFFDEAGGLGNKLGPVLVQLPPKLAFDDGVARDFLTVLRELHAGEVVCEPRHATWFDGAADRLLREFEVARVAADPAKATPRAAEPSGYGGLQYWRLHGSPRTYYSAYDETFLLSLATRIAEETRPVWVIFDNTAMGEATANALTLQAMLRAGVSPCRSARSFRRA